MAFNPGAALIQACVAVGTILALTTSSASATGKKDSGQLYFCISELDGNGSKRRYGVKISEGRPNTASGTFLIRAYDWPDEKDSSSLPRGALERLQISGVASGGAWQDGSEGCAKYGWRAQNQKYRAIMCTATQGVADIEVVEKTTGRKVFRADCDHVWVD